MFELVATVSSISVYSTSLELGTHLFSFFLNLFNNSSNNIRPSRNQHNDSNALWFYHTQFHSHSVERFKQNRLKKPEQALWWTEILHIFGCALQEVNNASIMRNKIVINIQFQCKIYNIFVHGIIVIFATPILILEFNIVIFIETLCFTPNWWNIFSHVITLPSKHCVWIMFVFIFLAKPQLDSVPIKILYFSSISKFAFPP